MTALLATGLLVAQAQAQDTVELETSEGTISIELYPDVRVAAFGNYFAAYYTGRPGGFVFHRSDKDLQCDVDSCACFEYDCTSCQDLEDPLFLCQDGQAAACSCTDAMTTPFFACTPDQGAGVQCPASATADPNVATCSCDDASVPAFACADESTPPGTCLELHQTDLTMPSAALYMGRYRLDNTGNVVAAPDYIPIEHQNDVGIFMNEAMSLAFVRDDSTGLITSQVVINVEDNADPFDGATGTGSDAYLVFGKVVAGQNVVESIARMATLDLSAQIDDGAVPPGETFLACSNPPAPLPSWIRGIPDAVRCDADDPWDQFPIIDFTGANPLPPINECVPGDADCQFPVCAVPGAEGGCEVPSCPEIAMLGGVDRCTAPLLPTCLDPGEPVGDVTPCLDPVCEDTFDDAGTTRCSEPLGPNFPVPEPTAAGLAAAALATLAALRRLRRA
ncbi:MAG: hypothetical protein VX466_16015 [Myxococcota bacterium]|nr:hypothetical protein [Myxococcota bacterium]